MNLQVEHDGMEMNFGSFKDLEIYMRLEKVQEVTVKTKYYLGIELPKARLTYDEVLQILND